VEAEYGAKRFSWVLSLLFLAGLLISLYQVLLPFLVPVAWAAVMAFITWPINSFFMRRLPKHRSLSALLMTLLLALVMVVAIVPLFAALTTELQEVVHKLKTEVIDRSNGGIPAAKDIPFLPDALKSRLAPHLGKLMTGKDALARFAYEYQAQLLGAITAIAARAAKFAFDFAVFLFAAFYLFRNGSALWTQVVRALKRVGGERFERLLTAMQETVKAAVYGTFVTAIVQGLLAGIGYLVADAPVPILLGVLTMVLALIPFGPPIIYLSASLLVVFEQSLLAGILLALWGVLVVSSIDNLVRPLFISQATKMPLILVFFGVLGGVVSFGFIGAFLGPALLAMALALWNEWTVDEVAGIQSAKGGINTPSNPN
jgi:predicted PurR-regulated permease PerM